MSNSVYYNSALAYDLENFATPEEKEPKIIDITEHLQKSPAKAKAVAKKPGRVVAIIAAIVFMAILSLFIFTKISLNQSTNEINDLKNEIEEAKSKITALDVELQRQTSLSNIELEAAELGMEKTQSDDVTYIRVNDSDKTIKED